MRMASNYVTATVKVTCGAGIKKSLSPQKICCDEKVPLPSATIQFLGGMQSAFSAIVKSNQNMFFGLPEVHFIYSLGCEATLCNPVQMTGKHGSCLLVSQR